MIFETLKRTFDQEVYCQRLSANIPAIVTFSVDKFPTSDGGEIFNLGCKIRSSEKLFLDDIFTIDNIDYIAVKVVAQHLKRLDHYVAYCACLTYRTDENGEVLTNESNTHKTLDFSTNSEEFV